MPLPSFVPHWTPSLSWTEKRAEASTRTHTYNRYNANYIKAREIARRKPPHALNLTPFDFLVQCAMLPDLIGSDRPQGIAFCIHAAERAGVGFPIHEVESIVKAFNNAISKLAQIMIGISSIPLSDRECAELEYNLARYI